MDYYEAHGRTAALNCRDYGIGRWRRRYPSRAFPGSGAPEGIHGWKGCQGGDRRVFPILQHREAPFQQLRRWMADGTVQAVGVLDRDRLQAQGLQRLVFLSECQERGIRVITVQGVPMLESSEGQLVELALALGKEKAVLRAQQGAKDGLRDRVLLRGLPATNAVPYGYRWEGGKLVPSDDWNVVQDIWRMASERKPLRSIAGTLTMAGVPTPRGAVTWLQSTIQYILHNPVYMGEYRALKSGAVEPLIRGRRGSTYGKSSRRLRPDIEHVLLPGVVTSPVVSRERFALARDWLKDNKRYAGGRPGRTYLLRGLIWCSECGKRYVGVNRTGRRVNYEYRCRGRHGLDVGRVRCPSKALNGPALEREVWSRIEEVLTHPDVFLAELDHQQQVSNGTMESLEADMKSLHKRLARLAAAFQKAFSTYSRGEVDQETYERTLAEFRAEETRVRVEKERKEAVMNQAKTIRLNSQMIKALYPQVQARLKGATDGDRRWVMECLGTRLEASPTSQVLVELMVPDHIGESAYNTPGSFVAPAYRVRRPRPYTFACHPRAICGSDCCER